MATALACGGGTEPRVGPPATLKVAGSAQQVPAGQALLAPLVVTVTDAQSRAVSGVTVAWSTSQGKITPASSVSDAQGQAQASWVVDSVAGPQTATATVTGLTPAVFSASVVPGAASKVAVLPAALTFTAVGESQQVTARVSDQYNNAIVGGTIVWSTSDAQVATVNGAGLVTARSNGAVTVTATRGTLAGQGTATVNIVPLSACGADTLTLAAVGTVLTRGGVSSLCLRGVAGSEYVLIASYRALPGSGEVALAVTGQNTAAATASPSVVMPGISAAVIPSGGSGRMVSVPRIAGDGGFERALRARERGLAPYARAAIAAAGNRARTRTSSGARYAIGAGRVLAVGDTVQFNANAESACSNADNHTGRVAAVSARTIIVSDLANPSGGFTDAEYQTFASSFDASIYATTTQAFGEPSDIDGNGRAIVIFTRAVNELTPAAVNYVIGGFFFARDLFPKAASATQQACGSSNEGEMFYMLAPDSAGSINGNARSKSYVLNGTSATLAHELQHLINASRRLFVVKTENFDEEVWLNEGLSHISEELYFYQQSGLTSRRNIGIPEITASQQALNAFNSFEVQNAVRYSRYLAAPESNSPYANNDDLATRGAAWSFLRYAADRKGPSDGDLFSRLVNTSLVGMDNLTSVLGPQVLDWVVDWNVANYTDDAFTVDARFTQPSWNHRSILPRLRGGSSTGAYPLATVEVQNATPTTVTVTAGGAAYLRLGIGPGGVSGVKLSNGVLPSDLIVNIVRTR